MAGSDARDPLSWPRRGGDRPEPVDLASLRVAISEDLGFAPVDDGIRAGLSRRDDRFAACSAGPTSAIRRSTRAPTRSSRSSARSTSSPRTPRPTETKPEVLGPNLRANLEQGFAMSLEDVARAMRRPPRLYRAFLDSWRAMTR